MGPPLPKAGCGERSRWAEVRALGTTEEEPLRQALLGERSRESSGKPEQSAGKDMSPGGDKARSKQPLRGLEEPQAERKAGAGASSQQPVHQSFPPASPQTRPRAGIHHRSQASGASHWAERGRPGVTTPVETQLSGADQLWRDKSKGGKSQGYISLDAESVPGPLSSG